MPWLEQKVIKLNLGTSMAVVFGPQDLKDLTKRVLVVSAAGGTGKKGLADADLEFGPTDAGPWFAEDLASSGIPTLAAGANAMYRCERADRYARFSAQAAAGEDVCDLTVYFAAQGS